MNRKAIMGREHRFFFRPDALPKVAPTIEVHFPTGKKTVALAALRADVVVSAVGNDLVSLQLAEAIEGSTRGLTGDEAGVGWLDLGARGQFPVRVLSVSAADEVLLADPLPVDVAAAGGTLAWNVWHGAFDAGATVQRSVRWSIDWEADFGADHPGEPRRDQGLLDVVRQPFRTGVTAATLAAHLPFIAGMMPTGQSSWTPQVDAALHMLVDLLRERLPSGRFEDDVDGRDLGHVHALLTLAHVLQGQRLAGYEREPREVFVEAYAALGRKLKRITWIDLDGDGAVGAGETAVDLSSLAGCDRSHVTAEDWNDESFERFGVAGER